MDSNMKASFEESILMEKELKAKPTGFRSPLVCIKLAVMAAFSILLVLWISVMKLIRNEDKLLAPTELFFYPYVFPPEKNYENNGYIMVSCNGGLNQMRTAIADMVVIGRYMNVTLIVPELDSGGYWQDHSSFEDIFDLNYFITSLRDEVRILKELPLKEKRLIESDSVYCMYPISFASMKYYYDKVLPRIKAHQVVRFTLADARLANNGLSDEVQKLRCRVYYKAMRFTREIEEMGQKIVSILRQIGPFLVLHLRYEKDMIAFTGCTEGFTKEETKELTKLRYSYAGWKHYPIDAKRRRQFGSCPLTPEETALSLQALGIDSNMTIYIAAGKIYANEKRMAVLETAYPNMVRKETLMDHSDLKPFQNYSNQMAALDYIVALESDIFVPTFGGNMARAVEGHRRYLGFRKTILLDRMIAVNLIDLYRNKTLSWEDFSEKMRAAHANKMGQPTRRMEKPDQPRYEDYFYSNPQECLPQLAEPPST